MPTVRSVAYRVFITYRDRMTPDDSQRIQAFIEKWQGSEGNERALKLLNSEFLRFWMLKSYQITC